LTLLLELDRARIDVAGAPLLDGVSLRSGAERLALVGDWRALFRLLGARASLVAGAVRIDGTDARRAVALGKVGLAVFEPPLPPGWRAREYVEWSGRLAGLEPKAARVAAARSLSSLGLAAMEARKLGTLMPMERRALMLAHAVVADPPVLAVERPLARLDEPAQRWLRELLERASAGRRLLVSVEDASGPGAERALVEGLDETLVLDRGSVIAQGPGAQALARDGRYLVTVLRHASELAGRLVREGAPVALTTGSGALEPVDETGAPIASDAARLVVTLPDGADTSVIIGACSDLDAPVIELIALGVTARHEKT
jgi:ABC-type multidrug transport system ATPase subunit